MASFNGADICNLAITKTGNGDFLGTVVLDTDPYIWFCGPDQLYIGGDQGQQWYCTKDVNTDQLGGTPDQALACFAQILNGKCLATNDLPPAM